MPTKAPTSKWIVLILVGFAQFMVVLDATITNVALPSIERDLGFSANSLQWVVNSYTLIFGGFLLLGGRAADLLGRKRLFLVGLTLFTAASLLNGIAQSEGMLIFSRGLQGLGGALVSPAALSIITTTFREGEERTRAMAVWGAIAAGGAAAGLLLGGMLTQWLSWRWNFLVNVPVGVGTALLALRLVPESRPDRRPSAFDLGGAVSVTAGLVVLVYAIVEAQNAGWGSAQTLGLAAGALVLLAAFVAIELRHREPLIRLDIFRRRTITAANTTMLVVAGGLFSMFFFMSIYMQQVLGYSPLTTGVAFLPVTAGIIAGSGLAQAAIARAGVKWVAVFGMLLAAGGLGLLAGVPADGSYAGDLLPGLLLLSFGMGNVFVPLTLIATSGTDNEDAGLASGLFNTSQQVGGALGLAVLSSLASDRTGSVLAAAAGRPGAGERTAALVEGFNLAFAVGAGLIGLGLLFTLLIIRRRDAVLIGAEAPAPAAA